MSIVFQRLYFFTNGDDDDDDDDDHNNNNNNNNNKHGLAGCSLDFPNPLTRVARWRNGRVPDLRSTRRGFESRPPYFRLQPWGSCSHTCLCRQAV